MKRSSHSEMLYPLYYLKVNQTLHPAYPTRRVADIAQQLRPRTIHVPSRMCNKKLDQLLNCARATNHYDEVEYVFF